ncbi:high affinity immunoglobulin epsilon receptor subunit gamma [Gasterosteus aculeatus]
MTGGGRSPLLLVISLWVSFGRASATLTEPQICYVLDGILFLYGIILTALYCRIKIINAKVATAENAKGKQPGDESIYTGLSPRAQDTYETIGMKK